MAIKLATPIEQEFTLDRSDAIYNDDPQGSPTRIGVAQASTREHERRSQLWSELTQEVVGGLDQPESIRYIQRISGPEIKRVEAFLTLTSCNIEDINGKPLFVFSEKNGRSRIAMTESEFAEAWGQLPVDVTEEIHEKIVEVNKSWRPMGE